METRLMAWASDNQEYVLLALLMLGMLATAAGIGKAHCGGGWRYGIH